MKICTFQALSSSERTLTVYSPDLIGDNTCSDYTDESMRQGFSWRSGNVDFYTIDSWGMVIDVEVFLNESVQLSPDAVRAIQVPFTIGPQGVGFYCTAIYIDVLGIVPEEDFGTVPCYLPMPPGEYALVFEQGFMPDWGPDGYLGEDENNTTSMWGKLWFNLETNAEAKILVQDSGLRPIYPLNMDAEPISEY
jgi:hypothetical protein